MLNFVLAVLVILTVVFGYLTIKRTGEVRGITAVSMQVNSKMMMFQSLVNDVNIYNQQAKSPEITHMIQNLQVQLSAVK